MHNNNKLYSLISATMMKYNLKTPVSSVWMLIAYSIRAQTYKQ